jgi:Barstar (barnase inhibitor)
MTAVPIVQIPVDEIVDWGTFHEVFARVLGFPDYYGRNLDAWIDCMTYVDDEAAAMISSDLVVGEGDIMTLHLGLLADFPERCREQYEALNDCVAFVNWRRLEAGERPILALSFYRRS